jgi:hypothetical protein
MTVVFLQANHKITISISFQISLSRTHARTRTHRQRQMAHMQAHTMYMKEGSARWDREGRIDSSGYHYQ